MRNWIDDNRGYLGFSIIMVVLAGCWYQIIEAIGLFSYWITHQ